MLKRLSVLLLLPTLVLASPFAPQDATFTKLAAEIWQHRMSYEPMTAAYYGSDMGKPLPVLDIQGLTEENNQVKQQIHMLLALDENKLSEQNRINRTILLHKLNDVDSQFKYKQYQIPILAEGGFHTSLGFLARSSRLSSESQANIYLNRLRQFPEYFNQQMAFMKQGLADGNTQPQIVLNGFESSIDGFITATSDDNPFYAPFKVSSPVIEPKQWQKLQQQAKQAISDYVIPSYKSFREFMVNTYIPQARASIAAADLPEGKQLYQDRVNHYTTLNMTVDEVHQLGLDEVKRIRMQMAKIIEQLEYKGDFEQFLTFLRTDNRFYASSAQELLKEASFIAKKMDAQLPKLFMQLPRTPYGVAPVPSHIAPKYTTGRYVGASKPTDSGTYWVNTYALERRPLYELEALTLHEAVPGHHLQISLAKEMENVPSYRSNYYISAFGEGWGLYAEWLGLEVGFYQDPYSNFGRLTYEMWRALRLVVDTGMHMKGWSRQQAIDYMKANSALSEHNIITEIDRYISWPGQALSYKIGELTIKRLRKQAEAELAEHFDVREFHYHVLKNGSVPLSLLEQQINMYIQDARAQ